MCISWTRKGLIYKILFCKVLTVVYVIRTQTCFDFFLPTDGSTIHYVSWTIQIILLISSENSNVTCEGGEISLNSRGL